MYTFNLSPSGQGAVTVDVSAAVCVDAAGNANSAATQFSRTYDSVLPSAVVSTTATDPTNTSPIPVTVVFSEPVLGFGPGGISTSNGVVNNFAGAGDTYTFDLVPSSTATVTASVLAGSANDAAGNPNTASNVLSLDYDNVDPTVSITTTATDPTNTSPIPGNGHVQQEHERVHAGGLDARKRHEEQLHAGDPEGVHLRPDAIGPRRGHGGRARGCRNVQRGQSQPGGVILDHLRHGGTRRDAGNDRDESDAVYAGSGHGDV